ncbi:helix-turn-helix transcriptional regulator [Alicyclobacillus macrosporangiidus]|jgi:excisionase family DNA binding protein|uniref:DNA binding domain-containing protein, excisionase family n=1 Tax=Alicyclobacillus macrosporangiidus TaxID=392015 RepID=A0A1I7FT98_9BACL|nr:helix-turn-helix domain-containing protein [Alicyclobacillus macrosporangiidus]SFU39390.1 DNA binding domain-containing protein, excisionase family [Alicyclobacillus macrosporangiidus]
MSEQLPPILTISDVARYLRIGRTKAYELAYRPDFPVIRIGRLVRVPRERFLAWCDSQGLTTEPAYNSEVSQTIPDYVANRRH